MVFVCASSMSCLQEMLQRVNDVLFSSVFYSLTAEDLRCHYPEVTKVHQLPYPLYVLYVLLGSVVSSFSHVSRVPPHIHSTLLADQPAKSVTCFKKWFWSVVEKMANEEKYDLVRQEHTFIVGWYCWHSNMSISRF